MSLKIKRKGDQWTAKEQWYSRRPQFFYTNWMMLNDRIALGCTDLYLAALDTTNGKLIGKWRGYGDGNLIRSGKHILALGGKGRFSVLDIRPRSSELIPEQRFQVTKARCWTAPTIIGSRIYIRHGANLHCLSFESVPSDSDLANQLDRSKVKPLSYAIAGQAQADPVMQIFTAFENKGKKAGLDLYGKLRQAGKLSAEQRIALAEAAWSQEEKDLAKMIMQHAVADLPKSEKIKQKLREWGG